jgi:hypothetical protein
VLSIGNGFDLKLSPIPHVWCTMRWFPHSFCCWRLGINNFSQGATENLWVHATRLSDWWLYGIYSSTNTPSDTMRLWVCTILLWCRRNGSKIPPLSVWPLSMLICVDTIRISCLKSICINTITPVLVHILACVSWPDLLTRAMCVHDGNTHAFVASIDHLHMQTSCV